jgi:hypothetical protein
MAAGVRVAVVQRVYRAQFLHENPRVPLRNLPGEYAHVLERELRGILE